VLAELSHRADELLATLQATQAELATHEAALGRADQEAKQRSAATLAMESEIEALRGAVTKSEVEILALRDTLDAARQIGTATIGGFRAEISAPTRPNGRCRWRHAVMRLVRREPGVVISRADRARDAGQWNLAAQLYHEALDKNPHNPPIWVQYGHALKESGDLRAPDKLAQAETAYRWALSLDPSAADPHLHLGHVLKLQGKTHEAEASYLRALARDPSMSYPLRELSRLGWSEAQLSELRSMLDCAVMSTSGPAEATPPTRSPEA
jgi:tetratricopeptide (TPR) repeat protein